MKSPHHTKQARQPIGWITRLLVACGTLMGSVSAMAAGGGFYGRITYAPLGGSSSAAPTAIPTMGGIGLVLLSAFLLLVFWRLHRSGAIQGGRFMVAALVSGALASGLGGVKLVSDAVAQGSTPWGFFLAMTNPQGGTLTFSELDGDNACVRNDTSVSLRIVALEEDAYGFAVGVSGSSDTAECVAPGESGATQHDPCTENMVLQPDGVCGVTLGSPAQT